MQEEMNLSVNGQSQVPPGFRFHPTEEELLHYYLRKKVASKKIDLDVIRDVDLNKLEPWDIQERCRIGSTPQSDWYFFSHKDKKYPTGTRTNRATAAGFWKATGRDKVIYSNSKRIGMRKTLVFYKGRAPHGQKSDWIMHEYRLDDNSNNHNSASHDIMTTASCLVGDPTPEDGWVVCRVFKKKNFHKAVESSQHSAISMDSRNLGLNSSAALGNDGIVDRILVYMGRTCKQEKGTMSTGSNIFKNNDDSDSMQFMITNDPMNSSTSALISEGVLRAKFMHLPGLESPISPTTDIPSSLADKTHNQDCSFGAREQSIAMNDITIFKETEPSVSCTVNVQDANCSSINTNTADQDPKVDGVLADWVVLDRLVACQLNGQATDDSSKDEVFCFALEQEQEHQAQGTYLTSNLRSSTTTSTRPNNQQVSQVCMMSNEVDFWSFARSSSSSSFDPLFHLSV